MSAYNKILEIEKLTENFNKKARFCDLTGFFEVEFKNITLKSKDSAKLREMFILEGLKYKKLV